jgi:RNA polymerase sigma-70 factor, ECF subfamily
VSPAQKASSISGRKHSRMSSSSFSGPPSGPVFGAAGALNDVVPELYGEILALARRHLRREATGHTLSTTALAHEAYLELARLSNIQWKSRAHFFSVCASVIRHVLVDYAVRRKAEKRGGGLGHVTLNDSVRAVEPAAEQWADLDEALNRLAALHPRQAKVVECRFFGGMSVEETAEALDIAVATVKRDWTIARAWLNRELSP